MLTELIRFVKRHFQRANNGLMQLVIIHALVFIILVIFKAACALLNYEKYYQLVYGYLVLPASWNAFLQQPWSIFTYFWIQEKFFVTIWNLAFLYAFGRLVVSIWHSRIIKIIYILGGIVAGMFFLLLYNCVTGWQKYIDVLVGPAGGLYAIMMVAVVMLPSVYFRLLLIGNVKIGHIAAVLLLLACFELSSHQVVGIAHLAGALVGYIGAKLLSKEAKYKAALSYFWNISRNKKKFKVSYRQTNKTEIIKTSELLNQEGVDIDAILDKVAVKGYAGLTKEEKEQLFRAGK